MKITKQQLKQIIKEELASMEEEQSEGFRGGHGLGGPAEWDPPGLEPGPEAGAREDIGADLLALQDQLQMQDGQTVEGMHSILIAVLGHLARAYGSDT